MAFRRENEQPATTPADLTPPRAPHNGSCHAISSPDVRWGRAAHLQTTRPRQAQAGAAQGEGGFPAVPWLLSRCDRLHDGRPVYLAPERGDLRPDVIGLPLEAAGARLVALLVFQGLP